MSVPKQKFISGYCVISYSHSCLSKHLICNTNLCNFLPNYLQEKNPRINSNDLSEIFYLSKKKKKLELKNRLKDRGRVWYICCRSVTLH